MFTTRSRAKLFTSTLLAAMIFTAASFTSYAAGGNKRPQNSRQTKLWERFDESAAGLREQRSVTPDKYLTFRLDRTSLRDALASLARGEGDLRGDRSIIMELPMPDGSIQHFRMEDAPVLSPELATQYSTWRFFQGIGIEDPTASGRFDWNAMGFHGYIETARGTVYIDPYQKGDTENYLVFYKHDFGESDNEFYCRVERSFTEIISSGYKPFLPEAPEFSFGTNLRTFKLAIATTGEWSRNAAGYNGTQTAQQIRDGALAVVTTSVNRLIGIYTRELSSSFQLVNPATNGANNIIWDDPATDPYDNTDGIPQLTINHNSLVANVGLANFDIGHLYGTGGGGVAQSPSLCSDADKGQGYSARGTNTGDPFTVDYVAHEMGHQFGSDHTYNNIDPNGNGSCPLSSYSAGNAYEPGSGSTIMSYVGICGSRNLQQYVEPIFSSFHIRSLTVINTNSTTGTAQSCGTTSGTNNIPTVNPGSAFNIPRLTPFTLTASGSDADGGDVANLLYSWEEYDLAQQPSGVAGTPANTYDVDSDGVLRPLFRTYSPAASNVRTFPSLPFILNPGNNDATADVNSVRGNQPVLTYTGTHPSGAPGAVCEPSVTCVIGERLPTANRTMNFRVSIRDRRGGVSDAGTSVTVNAAAGPFQITSENTAVTWTSGSTQTVTWDVAGTSGAPINAANVMISLSTDGGQTFPTVLLASTPNDGTQTVTVPSGSTTTARIKVEAVGNVFFDINNANITIAGKAIGDFDGDGKTDVAVYRPSEGNWYLNQSTAGLTIVHWGGAVNDVIVPGDFDGDNRADFAIWRPNVTDNIADFYVLNSNTFVLSGFAFGIPGDTPLVGDYDGDGKADLACFRPSTTEWYIYKSTAPTQVDTFQFGLNGDTAMTGDFNGDGKTDLVVYRPSTRFWFWNNASGTPAQNFGAMQWGLDTDKLVPADYDGDGKTDVAVFRSSDGTWYIHRSSDNANSFITFGLNGDIPVPGDYDGDGKADQAVYRNGTWYENRSTSGFTSQAFGLTDDKPVPAAYHP